MFMFLIALIMVSFSSCKKSFYCYCQDSNGNINWEGDVEATSKLKAESILAKECPFTATCE